MTYHCDTKAPAAVADDQVRPLVADGGEVVRYRLEAAEIEWEIAPDRRVRGYGFNGQVPGPVLEAKQSVPLEIEFTNRLPEPTVIHWHGLRIPAAMDGTEIVQRPIQPGETFTYRFTPPDAGTFWYHPHLNETEQLEKGLYGALIVRAADELMLDDEKVLVFDDLRVDKGGQIAKFGGLLNAAWMTWLLVIAWRIRDSEHVTISQAGAVDCRMPHRSVLTSRGAVRQAAGMSRVNRGSVCR